MREGGSTVRHEHEPRGRGRVRLRWWLALAGFLLIAGFFLFTEHRAHLLGALPYLLLLACPLLHLFMHRGHSRGGGGHH
jgi:hypothetical protein